MMTESELCPPRKQRALIFDRHSLTFEVHQAMLAALSLTDLSAKKSKILVCGTGAAALPMFLRHNLGDHLEQIHCIDSSKQIVELAQKYFGFTAGDGIVKSTVGDAHDYVRTTQEKYDVVFVDVAVQKEDELAQPP